MSSREAVADQLLPEITLLCLNKCIKPLNPAAAQGLRLACKYNERVSQFLARECFGRFPHFDRLRDCDLKVLRLSNQTGRLCPFCFGRIDQIEAKDVFLAAGTNVKTVSVVRRIRNETTSLKGDPVGGRRSDK